MTLRNHAPLGEGERSFSPNPTVAPSSVSHTFPVFCLVRDDARHKFLPISICQLFLQLKKKKREKCQYLFSCFILLFILDSCLPAYIASSSQSQLLFHLSFWHSGVVYHKFHLFCWAFSVWESVLSCYALKF